MTQVIPPERIESKILLIRGEKVMLDSDLAILYGVPTKRLVEQVRRNHTRFPEDFMFSLNNQEVSVLRSQFATSRSWGGRRYAPMCLRNMGWQCFPVSCEANRLFKST